MATVRLSFVRGNGLSSAAIAWMGSGPFSHVDNQLEDGSLLGARLDKCGGKPSGVQVRPDGYEGWKIREIKELPCTDAQKRLHTDFLLAQVGKQYDWTAIVGIASGRDWRQDDKWFCSELQTAALEQAGIIQKMESPSNWISPVALFNVFDALGAKTVYKGLNTVKNIPYLA